MLHGAQKDDMLYKLGGNKYPSASRKNAGKSLQNLVREYFGRHPTIM